MRLQLHSWAAPLLQQQVPEGLDTSPLQHPDIPCTLSLPTPALPGPCKHRLELFHPTWSTAWSWSGTEAIWRGQERRSSSSSDTFQPGQSRAWTIRLETKPGETMISCLSWCVLPRPGWGRAGIPRRRASLHGTE